MEKKEKKKKWSKVNLIYYDCKATKGSTVPQHSVKVLGPDKREGKIKRAKRKQSTKSFAKVKQIAFFTLSMHSTTTESRT